MECVQLYVGFTLKFVRRFLHGVRREIFLIVCAEFRFRILSESPSGKDKRIFLYIRSGTTQLYISYKIYFLTLHLTQRFLILYVLIPSISVVFLPQFRKILVGVLVADMLLAYLVDWVCSFLFGEMRKKTDIIA